MNIHTSFSTPLLFGRRKQKPTIAQSSDDLIRYYRRQGFAVRPGKGSHIHLIHSGLKRPLSIIAKLREVPSYILQQHAKTLGISRQTLEKAVKHNEPLQQHLSVLA